MIKIYYLLDETGSMDSVRGKTIEGYNAYVKARVEDTDAFITLVTFNSIETKVRYRRLLAKEIPPMTLEDYRPTATTPLYDAAMEVVRMAENEWRSGDQVLIVIMTDGEENASKEHKDIRDVFNKIDALQRKGWTFVFMGANQDAWAVSQKLGIAQGFVHTYDAIAPDVAFRNASLGTDRYMKSARSGARLSNFFKDDDANTLVGDEKTSDATP